ncbi:hypothetical protein CBOM_07542 [Ceraceosorus bombacis]|uniref:Uncharacterized protein n=1 Tax=Ceraceosorus bombacis TaxID=401625 RepID=A0A0N7L8Y4_9BASI|nr:hypothetical protein CBOM_07542 [Ceraceosorus bombacis]
MKSTRENVSAGKGRIETEEKSDGGERCEQIRRRWRPLSARRALPHQYAPLYTHTQQPRSQPTTATIEYRWVAI